MTPRTGGVRPGAGRKPSDKSRTEYLPAVRVTIVELDHVLIAMEPHETITDFVREAVLELVEKRRSVKP